MDGKRVRQINNLVITLTKEGYYKVWSPKKELIYTSRDEQDVIQRCKKCEDFLNNRHKSNINKLHTNKHKTHSIISYTGNKLKGYIESHGALKYNNRDFVKSILHYINKSESNRVLAISGLRGTGKTTGILQCIYKLNQFNNIAFISINSDANMDCSDLRHIIESDYADKDIIIIDEITRVKNFIKGISFLSDDYCSNNKKIIISGTDSLAIELSKWDALYHRIIDINVTFISYIEAKRTLNMTLSQYLEFGGLFKEDKIDNIDAANKYIETAIIDNVINTLNKNTNVTGLANIEGLDVVDIRTIVFKVLYSIIYYNIRNDIETDFNLIINLFNSKEIQNIGANTINEIIRQHLVIKEHVTYNIAQINEILKFMQRLGLIVDAKNVYNKSEVKYYITNPSLYNQLLKSIIETIEEEGVEKTNRKINTVYGDLFEAVILTHSIYYAKSHGLKVYYYRDNNNREIDLIFEKEFISEDLYKKSYAYYELKLNPNPDIVAFRTKWINNKEVSKYMSSLGTTLGKGIIYSGDTKTFNGYTDKQIVQNLTKQVKSKEKVDKQEKLNLGTLLISAEQYLLDTDSILKDLNNL